MSSLPERVTQLTFHKCGSQWVRDVLTAPEIAAVSGLRLVPGLNLHRDAWPEQPAGTFLGPLYNAAYEEWLTHRGPRDRAVVILRDPRDRLVSWVFSFSYSHVPNKATDVIREPLLALEQRHKLMLGLFEFNRVSKPFRSWLGKGRTEQEYVTTYERLISSDEKEFSAMLDFLGWSIPATTLTAVLARLSFRERSGRAPGETDIHSHYRRGVGGDWRNYFDQELGRLFETLFPQLLMQAGYETDANWPENLPESVASVEALDQADPQIHALRAEIVRLREEGAALERQNAELQRSLHAQPNRPS